MTIEDDLKALKEGQQAIREDIKNISKPLRDAISLTADLVGIVSIVGLPSAVLSLVDLFVTKPDKTAEALAAISELLQVTFSFDQSEANLTQMQRVTTLVIEARSRLQSLLQETQPYIPSALDDLNTTTLTKLNVLSDEASWKRVFFDQLLYQDYWFGRVLPPSDAITSLRPGRSFVFDYRLTLPCYLKAISVRLAAATILLGSDFVQRDAIISEIKDRATTLDTYYHRILRGFNRSRTPSFSDIQYVNIATNPLDPPLWTSAFDPFNPTPIPRPIGVIDAYEGAGLVDTYPFDIYPNRLVGPFLIFDDPPEEYFEFAARYELGSRKREKQLYLELSLSDAWTSMQGLRRASEQPTEEFDPMIYWSLREIIVALGVADLEIINVPPGSPPPNLSLWDTVRRLSIIGGVDQSQKLFVSMRGALDAAII